tara:strand:+ start:3191 stop:3478 length:288 start_codon:yes stop_codon:yes gene_type:complete
MLVEIKRLNIINDGYNRKISIDKMYVNSNHIVSISDYDGVKQFLLSESLGSHENDNFSLIKMSNATTVEEIIVLGTSEEIFAKFDKSSRKVLLNE